MQLRSGLITSMPQQMATVEHTPAHGIEPTPMPETDAMEIDDVVPQANFKALIAGHGQASEIHPKPEHNIEPTLGSSMDESEPEADSEWGSDLFGLSEVGPEDKFECESDDESDVDWNTDWVNGPGFEPQAELKRGFEAPASAVVLMAVITLHHLEEIEATAASSC